MFFIKNKKTGEYWHESDGWVDVKQYRAKYKESPIYLPRNGELIEDAPSVGFYKLFQGQRDHKDIILDVEKGIGSYVIIQAEGYEQFRERAKKIGIEFGYQLGDCRNCSPRWTERDDEELEPDYESLDEITMGGKPLKFRRSAPSREMFSGFVHYLNGKIKYFCK